MSPKAFKGSCLCGAVNITVDVEHLPDSVACHCSKCRKWTGLYSLGVEVPRTAVSTKGADNITWYRSSEHAQRGFCTTRGTNLFFDPTDHDKHDWTGVMMGVFDEPTKTKIQLHIFAADKGDYYDILDDAPQNAQ